MLRSLRVNSKPSQQRKFGASLIGSASLPQTGERFGLFRSRVFGDYDDSVTLE